jgi:hypothetical protein
MKGFRINLTPPSQGQMSFFNMKSQQEPEHNKYHDTNSGKDCYQPAAFSLCFFSPKKHETEIKYKQCKKNCSKKPNSKANSDPFWPI